jgi:hypothetical protein
MEILISLYLTFIILRPDATRIYFNLNQIWCCIKKGPTILVSSFLMVCHLVFSIQYLFSHSSKSIQARLHPVDIELVNAKQIQFQIMSLIQKLYEYNKFNTRQWIQYNTIKVQHSLYNSTIRHVYIHECTHTHI